MPTLTSPCPHCQGLSVWLETLSSQTSVNYYRCSHCTLVWSARKDVVTAAREPIPFVAAKRVANK
jgi:hypothetical protein